MAALQAGDDTALAELMSRWEVPVKAFLLRLGVPSQSVEDIAQDAFVRLYEKRARFKPGSALKPWLLTLAGNLARNALRWKSRHPTESLEASGPEDDSSRDLPDPAGRSPSESAVERSRGEEVRAAVAGLPAPLRMAVVCVDLEEMSYDEAAIVMSCSRKAVETRLYRARRLLRDSLRSFLPDSRSG